MRNTLNDLNNALFEQLERLQDDELDIEVEIKRSKAVSEIAAQIINSGELAVKTFSCLERTGNMNVFDNKLLGIKNE